MQVKELRFFIHGPFPTRKYIATGQIKLIDDNLLNQDLKDLKEKKRIKEHHKQSIVDGTRKFNSSVFSNVERIDDGIRFVLPDFKEISESAEYRFESNAIYFYESGTGMFSTEVAVTFQQEQNISVVKEAEKFACSIVMDKLKNDILDSNKVFSEIIASNKLKELPGISSESFELGHLAWLHMVYFLKNDNFFKDDTNSVKGQLKDDVCRDFSLLLGQILEDMSPLVDRYVFYGWGRSLILTKSDARKEEVIRLVRLLEIFQYFCFGLYQLDTFLTKEMHRLNIGLSNKDEPVAAVEREDVVERELKKLRSEIRLRENIRSFTIRYLEQFRYSSNVVFVSGERALIEKLEEQWGLDHIEDGIRNKLDLFERDLSSQERALLAKQQALIAQKQDLITDEQRYLNKLILALTVVALGGAIAEVVVLSPLNDMFPENAQFFYQSQLFLTLIASGVLTVVILIMYTRTLKMRNPYRVKQIFTKSKRNT